ncbi:MAG: site-specific integrase [Flavobacteriales bacterium]|nr:site-specific integrase [Flavobacteriales bacterium]
MLINRYLEHLAHERRSSPHTVAAYKADLDLFMAYLGESGIAQLEAGRWPTPKVLGDGPHGGR